MIRATLERVFRGEKPGVRPAESQRHPEPLRRAHRDIRSELARRAQQREREQVSRHDRERADRMSRGKKPFEVVDRAGCIRILDENTEAIAADFKGAMITHDDADPERGARPT